MECGICGCQLDGADMPCYLYACGDMTCFLHVLSPFCYQHSEANGLLIGDISTDQEIKRLKGIRDWLERENSGNSLQTAISGVKADIWAYVSDIANGRKTVSSANQEDCCAYWVCTQCSSQNQQGSQSCWRCQTYPHRQSGAEMWSCPWCQGGHYQTESTCQCGYPGEQPQEQLSQSVGGMPIPANPNNLPVEEAKRAVLTAEAEIQAQPEAISTENMTEPHCDHCDSAVFGQYLCGKCVLPHCAHCRGEMESTEVMCEGCRANYRPICCGKCGKSVPEPSCEDCWTEKLPKMVDMVTETIPLLCVKCRKIPANEGVCGKCSEPEPLRCSICQEIAAKDSFTCERCHQNAILMHTPSPAEPLKCSICHEIAEKDLFTCEKCQQIAALVSTPSPKRQTPQSKGSPTMLSIDFSKASAILEGPRAPVRPVERPAMPEESKSRPIRLNGKAAVSVAVVEEGKSAASRSQAYAGASYAQKITEVLSPYSAGRQLKSRESPVEGVNRLQHQATRPLSAVPVAGQRGGKVVLRSDKPEPSLSQSTKPKASPQLKLTLPLSNSRGVASYGKRAGKK